MAKITEIYEKYKIPPNLQLHQLRVAGVASLVCDSFDKPLDKNSIITACLLHDMGNIIKFNFDVFPIEFYGTKGRTYWEKVKQEFIERYGENEHEATYKIIRELNISEKITYLVKAFGYVRSQDTLSSEDYELKIASYSDHRAGPHGILSMRQRHDDGRKRYVLNKKARFDKDFFEARVSEWQKIEQQIFEHCKIRPEDITDENINPLVEELKSFEIETGRGGQN